MDQDYHARSPRRWTRDINFGAEGKTGNCEGCVSQPNMRDQTNCTKRTKPNCIKAVQSCSMWKLEGTSRVHGHFLSLWSSRDLRCNRGLELSQHFVPNKLSKDRDRYIETCLPWPSPFAVQNYTCQLQKSFLQKVLKSMTMSSNKSYMQCKKKHREYNT